MSKQTIKGRAKAWKSIKLEAAGYFTPETADKQLQDYMTPDKYTGVVYAATVSHLRPYVTAFYERQTKSFLKDYHDNRARIERYKPWAFEGAAGERRIAREKIKDRGQLVTDTLRNFVRVKHGIPLLFAAIDRIEAPV